MLVIAKRGNMAKTAFFDVVARERCDEGVDPRQTLVDLYDQYHSLRFLAAMFNCDPSTISKNLKECRLMGYRSSNGGAHR